MTNSVIYDGRTLNTSPLPAISDIEIIGAANGTLIAVWTAEDGTASDNSGSALVVRVFDAFGNPLIPEGQANTAETFGDQFDPDLVALDDGGAALVYTSSTNITGSSNNIWFERRDAEGQVVNKGAIELASTDDSDAVVTGFGNNGLLVAYQSDNGVESGLFARVVDASGNVSSRIIVDDQFDSQFAPSVDILVDGRAAIAYLDQSGTNTSLVRIALIDPAYNGFAGNFVITPTATEINAVDIAALSDGNFVVVWEEVTPTGRNVFYQVNDASGNVINGRAELFSILEDERYQPVVEATADGFVVSVVENDINPNNGLPFELPSSYYFENDGDFQSGRGSGRQESGLHIDLAVTADDRAVLADFSDLGFGPQIRVSLLDDYRDEVVGTAGNDTLVANNFDGINVWGRAGDDLLYSLDRDDGMFGEAGNDTIIGSGGDDLIDGGVGFDTLDYGGLRYAVVLGSQGIIDKNGIGTDTLASTVVAGGLTNSIERIVGDTGFLQRGNNTIDGENSTDSTFNVDLEAESLTILLSASSPIVGDRLDFEVVNFTDVLGTGNNDIISGDGQSNLLVGADGNDTLYGQSGNDRLDGGVGNDILSGGSGSDYHSGGDGYDTVYFDGFSTSYTVRQLIGSDEIEFLDSVDIDLVSTDVESIVFWNKTVDLASISKTIYNESGATLGWYQGWGVGWHVDWFFGWGVGWNLNWYFDGLAWSYGWTYGWYEGWHYGWNVGWNVGWFYGWN
ncbi:MAG: calcium-binding protein [Pseudomonadota bacterium]